MKKLLFIWLAWVVIGELSAQNNNYADMSAFVAKDKQAMTEERRIHKLASILVETDSLLGWNDEAYSVKVAKNKWHSGEAMFLLQGGIASVVYKGQEQFKDKYGVDYYDFGCIAPISERRMKNYNTAIMDYLTDRFGEEWRSYIRKDVPGFNEYGKKAFKKIEYDDSGIAITVLPVVFKFLGKAVELNKGDSEIIRELVGHKPLITIVFLYRGIEYCFPVSCSIDAKEIPITHELIEITVRFFNPKTFKYSTKTIPYPLGIIERIDYLN